MKPTEEDHYYHGRGAQVNPANKYLKGEYVQEHAEGIDEWWQPDERTEYIEGHARSIVNKVDSPDIGMWYSLNPYQGCEHGCIYCYARNAHEYWGFSAGMDFEHKIVVKKNAPALLRRFLENKNWKPVPISLSGNTDCYQPVERKLKITRQLLQVALEYRQPVGMITKNALVLRDRDILAELARHNLAFVFVSITAMDEKLRQVMEPRTATYKQRLRVLKELSEAGVPTGVMSAPMIPGINDQEMPKILQAARDNGARMAGYTIVRCNGAVGEIFRDWLFKNFPDRADKVWHLIESCHNGQVNDSRWGKRMKGEGLVAGMIAQQFRIHTRRLGLNQEKIRLDTTQFRRPRPQLSLF
ncbi:PA0069 family radical SAM protein [Compostibacter hankyongensis]|uniref:PA0069 family radical SAM protein n=1 Tax=Compostibacter hankyongensis TaxID=1007089 RepID=A0ABP8FFW8_9BACT